MEHPSLPGWQIATAHFDTGATWGVAIDNGKDGPARRRHAVRVPKGDLSDAEAIAWAVPTLARWAAE